MQLKKLLDDFVKAYGATSGDVLKELRASGDALTKKTLDSYYKFQREQMAWTRVGLQRSISTRRLIGFRFT